jgi:hypothetical protein
VIAYSAPLDVRFRGTRNYVHSTDVYPLILLHAERAQAPVAGDLRIDFTRIVNRGLEIFMFPKGAGSIDPLAAFTFSYRAEFGWVSGYLTQTEIPVSQQYDGDDESIYSRIELFQEELAVVDPTGLFETIDLIAALASKHERFEPASEGRKWLIARLELLEPLPQRGPKRVSAILDRRLGTTSIRSKLTLGGKVIGRLTMVQGRA